MRRWLSWIAVFGITVVALVVATDRPGPTPGVPSTAARMERLTAGLRCPVCQGLSVRDSASPAARSMTADIERRIGTGESDAGIRRAYVDRYGEWILLRPNSDGVAALVWALPGAGGVLAVGALALAFWRWRRLAGMTASADDDRLVDDALGQRREAR